MATSLKLGEKFVRYLKDNPGKWVPPKEIAEWVFKNYPEECARKREQSSQSFFTDKSFINQLITEIPNHYPAISKKNPNIRRQKRGRNLFYCYTTESQREPEQMVAPLKLGEKIVGYLKGNPGQWFTAREIAEWVFKNHPEECARKREQSSQSFFTDKSFINQLVTEIPSYYPAISKKDPNIRRQKKGRKLFYCYTTESQREPEQMVAPLKLGEKIVGYLKGNPGQWFTAREIAEWVFKNYPKECARKREQSSQSFFTDKSFINQLVTEIPSYYPAISKKDPNIRRQKKGRKLFYCYTTESQREPEQETLLDLKRDPNLGDTSPLVSTPKNKMTKKEELLYPKLAAFLRAEYGTIKKTDKPPQYVMHSKRIREYKSSNKGGPGRNKWLHPDMVAMQDLASDWDPAILAIVQSDPGKRVKLWSFEVKQAISLSNVRKSFAQAIMNSSWANYGYLVAAELNENAKSELQILSSLHGIGYINLDIENPPESQIIFPARERDNIDWDTANRLAVENGPFKKYIQNVNAFLNGGKTTPNDWDNPGPDDKG